jgi:serine protease Do
MTLKKLLLTVAMVLSCGLLAGGIVYAQVAAEAQQPATPRAEREFSLLIDGGSFLGVYAEDISKENMGRYGLSDVRGIGITEIVKDSPAEKAGLKKDDVIVRFEGESITSVRKLNRLVSEAAPDHTVRLTVSRGGAEQEVSVTLAKRNEAQNFFGSAMPNEIFKNLPNGSFQINPGLMEINPGQDGLVYAFGGNRHIGISTQALTKQLADYFGVKDGGLLVTSVSENTPAAKAGLKAGDVITAVDGEKVESSGDIARAINKKEDGDITLTIIRDRSTQTIKVTPEKTQGSLMRTGRLSQAEMRDAIKRGAAEGRIMIPQVDLPAIPAMNIQLPRIQIPRVVLPSTPEIDVTMPHVKVIRNPI